MTEQQQGTGWTPDSTQQHIIDTQQGCHLVLAPPGCGKTQILAERVRKAHEKGVAYGDMLCLTFTNRAARGMRERIGENIDDAGTADVFVGNVHRYCSRFLFEHGLVAAESAIIDDDTMMSILAMYLQEDEGRVLGDSRRRRYYSQIMFFAHLMYEVTHGVPPHLRQHPDCVTRDDMAVLRALCRTQHREFTAEAMIDIYDHTDYYTDVMWSEVFDSLLRPTAEQTLLKMRYAHAYTAYKAQNRLLDFEDLLLLTYTALTGSTTYKRYPWIQVDEVQDLNPLQLAIIDALSTCDFGKAGTQADTAGGTVMYLGDEQQAIFSFMGSKMSTLQQLKQRCGSNVHHLGVNHRSPKYLVDMLNDYAMHQLGSDGDLLPRSKQAEKTTGDELQIISSDTVEDEFTDVARLVKMLADTHPAETTAVIVNANRDADTMSDALHALDVDHFKVSGEDLFSTPELQLLLSHLSVLANEHNFLAWTRLMKGLRVCQTSASARQFVHRLEVRGITPADLFRPDGSTYVQEFLRLYEEHDLVVFDTETTGLDVFEDDVVQIAAEKIRHGQVVDRFCVHIETSREIPQMLGDIANPIIEERKRHTLVPPTDALRAFITFAGDGILLAHNAEYDYHIMDYNVRRYLPEVDWQSHFHLCIDSLKLIRLLRPDLKAFKLKLLLVELGLEGQNSHLADDDVFATVQLVNYCYGRGGELRESQQEYLGRATTHDYAATLRRNYQALFEHGRSVMYRRGQPTSVPAAVEEMRRLYATLRNDGLMGEVKKLDAVLRYLSVDVIDAVREPSLQEQLSRHILEMNTLKEADLCGSSALHERIFVTTIHKAKGLEFDNVIVFDAVDGRIPNYYNEGNPTLMAEDARKLYVAMSRAKRRLYVSYSNKKVLARDIRPQRLSRFMEKIGQKHFRQQQTDV